MFWQSYRALWPMESYHLQFKFQIWHLGILTRRFLYVTFQACFGYVGSYIFLTFCDKLVYSLRDINIKIFEAFHHCIGSSIYLGMGYFLFVMPLLPSFLMFTLTISLTIVFVILEDKRKCHNCIFLWSMWDWQSLLHVRFNFLTNDACRMNVSISCHKIG